MSEEKKNEWTETSSDASRTEPVSSYTVAQENVGPAASGAPQTPPAAPRPAQEPAFRQPYAGYGYGAQGGYAPNPVPPKPPRKKQNGVVITLAILYVALIAVLLALIAGGTLRLGTVPSKEKDAGKTVTEEPASQNAPLVPDTAKDSAPLLNSATDLYNANVGSVVFVQAASRRGAVTGSGFVVDAAHGYIMTNCHVVENSNDISVTFKNGDSYTATLVGGDSINDVAILKINASGLKSVTIGNSDLLTIGQDILVIGNPLGDLTFTLTKGIVSGVDRSINTGEYTITTFQTDAAINSGNSGGPAFDAAGNVVGIASAKYAAAGVEGLNFCIPINDAMTVAKDLVEYGYVKNRPNFGITVSTSSGMEITTDEFGRRVLTESIKGARVEEVAPGSCAEKAGLKKGDVITKIDNLTITTSNQLINAKNAYKAGDTVILEVYRGGETLHLTVVFDEYTPEN